LGPEPHPVLTGHGRYQDVGGRIAGIGVEHEVELDPVRVADDRDIIALGPAHQREPEHPLEGQGAVEIAHPNADVIDPFDGDGLRRCDLPSDGPAFSVPTAATPARVRGCF
jgi:hypothetical protein